MRALVNHNHKTMNEAFTSRLLLFSTYILNAGAWASNIWLWAKIILTIITGITTILAFFNQWDTFKKKYRTLWIIVKIEHIFSPIKQVPKKNLFAKLKRRKP